MNLAYNYGHQPQQLMTALNRLVLSGGFDIVVNLDGLDDAWWPVDGQYHGFPHFQLTSDSVAIAKPLGVVAALRERHSNLAQLAEIALRNRLDDVEGHIVESTEALAELVLTDGGACAFERELPTFLRLRTSQYDAESSAPYWQRDIGHA